MIEVKELPLSGVKLIYLRSYADSRGFFEECYRRPLYVEKGICSEFLQDNYSVSKKGTLRGMHFQKGSGQAKLISVLVGSIYDVFVDIRQESPTFGKWGSRVLLAQMHEQIYLPEGYAHGFVVLSDEAHVFYKVSTLYDPAIEGTFYYNDPQVGIEWPVTDPILSEKDKNALSFSEVFSECMDLR